MVFSSLHILRDDAIISCLQVKMHKYIIHYYIARERQPASTGRHIRLVRRGGAGPAGQVPRCHSQRISAPADSPPDLPAEVTTEARKALQSIFY